MSNSSTAGSNEEVSGLLELPNFFVCSLFSSVLVLWGFPRSFLLTTEDLFIWSQLPFLTTFLKMLKSKHLSALSDQYHATRPNWNNLRWENVDESFKCAAEWSYLFICLCRLDTWANLVLFPLWLRAELLYKTGGWYNLLLGQSYIASNSDLWLEL